MIDRVSDPRLRGKVDHNVEVVLFEEGVDESLIADATLHEYMLHW